MTLVECEFILVKKLMTQLDNVSAEQIKLYCDIQSTMNGITNPTFFMRTKPTEIDCYLVKGKKRSKIR